MVALATGLTGCGWLGVHKFMMGYKKEGLTSIGVTVGTLGAAWPVMTGIAALEGLIYLSMSDEEFYMKYVVGERGWL